MNGAGRRRFVLDSGTLLTPDVANGAGSTDGDDFRDLSVLTGGGYVPAFR